MNGEDCEVSRSQKGSIESTVARTPDQDTEDKGGLGSVVTSSSAEVREKRADCESEGAARSLIGPHEETFGTPSDEDDMTDAQAEFLLNCHLKSARSA